MLGIEIPFFFLPRLDILLFFAIPTTLTTIKHSLYINKVI